MKRTIRVLVVDDSAVMRQLLTEILSSDPGIEVVGTAPDPYVARDKIKLFDPDVLTLDVEMPRMSGLVFLRNLMRLRPMPVVMCSSLTQEGADVALDALALGAVDFVAKPTVDAARGIREAGREIISKVKIAARARVRPLRNENAGSAADQRHAEAAPRRPDTSADRAAIDRIIAIGASTGGTEAIKAVLERLPANLPGIVIVQHIPKTFSGPFAMRMNASCALEVCEARDRQSILPGHVYIAPGDRHLIVTREGERYVCRLIEGEPVNRHRPSVDMLFRSVARAAGANSIGVMLTGMGRDGAEGMKEMRDAGGWTIAQDEDTSVVWGMPGAAYQLGAVESVHPLLQIAACLVEIAVAAPRSPHCERRTY